MTAPVAPGLGVLIVGRLPNGRVEGLHLDTPENSAVSIKRAKAAGRYSEVMAATVYQREAVE